MARTRKKFVPASMTAPTKELLVLAQEWVSTQTDQPIYRVITNNGLGNVTQDAVMRFALSHTFNSLISTN